LGERFINQGWGQVAEGRPDFLSQRPSEKVKMVEKQAVNGENEQRKDGCAGNGGSPVCGECVSPPGDQIVV
jgi:hypothetical protein